LNQHLYLNTTAEKYATLFLSLYDDATGRLTYTNAGHAAPILVRGREVRRLDPTGTVVGAFPSADFEEESVQLESGDLLVCFTDGVTEPENAYGEMFGEERFADLMAQNAERGEEEIIQTLLAALRQWTGSDELQDDLTLLLARRI